MNTIDAKLRILSVLRAVKYYLTDRYQALGIPYPDTDTMCKGPCEGIGVFPLSLESADTPERKKLWSESKDKEDEIGYKFVTCPDCGGTGLRPTVKACLNTEHPQEDFSDPDLRRGIQIELDWGADPYKVVEIAIRNLSSDPWYYSDPAEVIMQAIGAASMCWSEAPSGVFDATRAETLGKDVLRHFGIDAALNTREVPDKLVLDEIKKMLPAREFEVFCAYLRGDSPESWVPKKVLQEVVRRTYLPKNGKSLSMSEIKALPQGALLSMAQEGCQRFFDEIKRGVISQARIRAAGEAHSWGCIMADFPESLAEKAKEWAKENIPAESVYDTEEKDRGLETAIHVTVAYGVDPKQDPELVQEVTKSLGKPVEVRLGKVSKFEQEKYDVIKVEVISPDLHALHEMCKEELGLPGNTFPDYVPHMTLGYVLPKSCDNLLGATPFEGMAYKLEDFDYSYPKTEGAKDTHVKYSVKASITAGIQDIHAAYRLGFWVSPEGEFSEFNLSGMSHAMAYCELSNQSYADLHEKYNSENAVVDIAIRSGWVRGLSDSGILYLLALDEGRVLEALRVLPNSLSVHTLGIELRNGKSLRDIPVLEGEDALEAWEHRNDIRHRVEAAGPYTATPEPKGKPYKSGNKFLPREGLYPDAHPLVVHDLTKPGAKKTDIPAPSKVKADKLNDLYKAANAEVQEDPKWVGYQTDPAKAKALGEVQQKLKEARSEQEIQDAWEQYQPSLSFDQLLQKAQQPE